MAPLGATMYSKFNDQLWFFASQSCKLTKSNHVSEISELADKLIHSLGIWPLEKKKEDLGTIVLFSKWW